MSLKSEKLTQRLQEIQKFVAERTDRNETYVEVAEELMKITNSLKEGKLSVQIVSRYSTLSQALQNFCNNYETLQAGYQFNITNLPSNSNSQPIGLESPATLIRQNILNDQIKHNRHQLSTIQNTVIGRSPQCQVSIDDRLTLVSGCHAEIQPLLVGDAHSTNLKWQICDRSNNGTYINGKQLLGCQTLQTGDRITLASPGASTSSPEFIFECRHNPNKCYSQLTNCNILCVVINVGQMLSMEEKQIILEMSKISSSKIFVIVDVPTYDNQTQLHINNLSAIEAWLFSQTITNFLELVTLQLKPFYPSNQQPIISLCSQEKLDRFAQSLIKQSSEDDLLRGVTTAIVSQLHKVEGTFKTQEECLNKEICRDEDSLQKLGKEELKEQLKKYLKIVNDDKDKTFKQIKIDLNQSKAALIDIFSKKSISYKIQQLTDELKPIVVKNGGDRYIQLRAVNTLTTNDANSSLVQLCYSTLSCWAKEEWENICNFYADGGLNGVFKRTYTTLNFTPAINLTSSSFRVKQNIDTQKNFKTSSVTAPCESRYYPISPIGYISKQLRTQAMQWMFLLTIVTGSLALFGLRSVQNGGKSQIIQNIVSPLISLLIDKPLLLAVVLTLTLFIVFTSLAYAFQNEKRAKIEQETDKLQKTLCNYYQSLAKSLIEKTVQDFNLELEAEEQSLKQSIEIEAERITVHIAEIEKKQLLIKSNLEKRKAQQKILEKEKANLYKLKRF